MRVRIIHPTTLRLDLRPGDELHLQTLPPQVQTLLASTRLDGVKVARLVGADEDEVADESHEGEEHAVTGRGRGRSQRAAAVS